MGNAVAGRATVAWDTHDDVVVAVPVDVDGDEISSKSVVLLGAVDQPADVLMERLVAGRGQSRGRAKHDVEIARIDDRADVLVGHADREVLHREPSRGVRVPVEGARGQCAAEVFAGVRNSIDPP